MNKIFFILSMLSYGALFSQSNPKKKHELTFATYNVSMESENYFPRGTKGNSEQVLIDQLNSGTNVQIKNIAQIIQTVRPDVILLNEFDYIENPELGVKAFIKNYLKIGQGGAKAINYPYYYYSTVNTGQPSPYDLNNDGKLDNFGNDAWGFGMYPGQYAMVLLSKYPIDVQAVRTFQNFKWKDMPGALLIKKPDGSDWYREEVWAQFPLSSKSHWDVPVKIGKKTVHILASHPTPASFDGDEDRNGKRNHDEIRFWRDYISDNSASYIYDDKGLKGGLSANSRFVILGDQNASPVEGSAIREGIKSLLDNPKINNEFAPSSKGGMEYSPQNPFGINHTAFWRMRADYVLPSKLGFKVISSGVFWPAKGEPMSELVEKRESSSDHRLVWVKVILE
ncbi:endonuclease/exonuclease/phosphatase family protein [Flavobacterium quisquiliarum]|uniref:Endonuclease/exonuclease/phosphatase family protein n=1 Tax=Flavobacterium quisquiliarum TaxID=1834436 RepID=A0ABV8W108_9FLAO|nr:endonuclease/exonuclease/phosphatase family protein [Flavobacterium quisquiliarum]MBW1655839.1 endonuclease/exonuclease/phosphatase family protein [Flavobacterium quisquiliarum]NWL01414.1 endonuclease/exonuclease/phosphatase family protein [Flavobacterium collinsii]